MTVPQAIRLNTDDPDRIALEDGRWRPGVPQRFFEQLAGLRIGQPGQRLLEVAAGAAELGRGFALRGVLVTAVDTDEALLDLAARLDRAAGVFIDYRVGRAEATGLADGAFDAVLAGPGWRRTDRKAALREALRVLRPGGRIVLAPFEWLPQAGPAAATEELTRAYGAGETAAHGLHPGWLEEAVEAGFESVESSSFDLDVGYSHVAWRRRIRSEIGERAEPAALDRLDVALRLMLAREFPAEPMLIRHRAWTLVARKP